MNQIASVYDWYVVFWLVYFATIISYYIVGIWAKAYSLATGDMLFKLATILVKLEKSVSNGVKIGLTVLAYIAPVALSIPILMESKILGVLVLVLVGVNYSFHSYMKQVLKKTVSGRGMLPGLHDAFFKTVPVIACLQLLYLIPLFFA